MKKPSLKISINDPKIEKILQKVEKHNISFSLKSKKLVIDASNPKNNEVLTKIMEMSKDYLLS